MAKCDRAGVVYKRHKFNNGKCERCGASQLQASVDRAKRRANRRTLLGHPPTTGGYSGSARDRRKQEPAVVKDGVFSAPIMGPFKL